MSLICEKYFSYLKFQLYTKSIINAMSTGDQSFHVNMHRVNNVIILSGIIRCIINYIGRIRN